MVAVHADASQHDMSRGDTLLIRLRYRCSNCRGGSQFRDWVMTNEYGRQPLRLATAPSLERKSGCPRLRHRTAALPACNSPQLTARSLAPRRGAGLAAPPRLALCDAPRNRRFVALFGLACIMPNGYE